MPRGRHHESSARTAWLQGLALDLQIFRKATGNLGKDMKRWEKLHRTSILEQVVHLFVSLSGYCGIVYWIGGIETPNDQQSGVSPE